MSPVLKKRQFEIGYFRGRFRGNCFCGEKDADSIGFVLFWF